MKTSSAVNMAISSPKDKTDLILVGAGLGSSILACFLLHRHPHLRILIFESAREMAPEKTWSFHHSDLTSEQFEILKPAIEKTWSSYEVRFPHFSRVLDSAYSSIRPAKLQKHLEFLIGSSLRFNSRVTEVSDRHVKLLNGEHFEAACVIDARGLDLSQIGSCGYQKFVGLHVELHNAHGLTRPVLMDATIPQVDGYRFIYTLPWNENELLIEDTRYSNEAALPVDEYLLQIQAYAERKDWQLKSIKAQEKGVLPIPLWPVSLAPVQKNEAPKFGMAGGFFHPVTGYSLPDSVRLADRLSNLTALTSQSIQDILTEERKSQSWNHQYLCFLNRMMFQAANPNERFRIFERFYGLNKNLIGRFYHGSLPLRDKLRIVMGSPPVPVRAAVRCLWRPNL